MKLEIEYGQFTLEAKAASHVSAKGQRQWCNPFLLEKARGKPAPPFATLEPNAAVLDGSLPHFQQEKHSGWGFYSQNASDATGVFQTPPTLTVTFDGRHSSGGITLYFSPAEAVGGKVEICWQDETGAVLHKGQYTFTGCTAVLPELVQGWAKITIAFLATGVPQRFIKLWGIEYGPVYCFEDEEIGDATLLEQVSPLADSLPINTLQFTARNKTRQFSLPGQQETDLVCKGQPLAIFADGKPYGRFFLENRQDMHNNGMVFSYTAESALAILEKKEFLGGIYNAVPAERILAEIQAICFTSGLVTMEMEQDLCQETISGYLPITDCRTALRQLAFALGAMVETTREGNIWLSRQRASPVQTKLTLHGGEKWCNPQKIVCRGTPKRNAYVQLEPNATVLDGTFMHLPTAPHTENTGWWSSQISTASGKLASPIALQIEFDRCYKTQGVRLYFCEKEQNGAAFVTATWYGSRGERLAQGTFAAEKTSCQLIKYVANCKRIVIEICQLTLPYRRLKITGAEVLSGGSIGLNRIYLGGSNRSANYYTSVTVEGYHYTANDKQETAFSGKLEAGKQIIRFKKPYHSLQVQGAVLETAAANYAVVRVPRGGEVSITAKGYIESKQQVGKQRENLFVAEENAIQFSGATLVCEKRAKWLVEHIWEHLTQTVVLQNEIQLEGLLCGAQVEMETLGGEVVGQVQSIRVNLRSGKAQVEVHGKAP